MKFSALNALDGWHSLSAAGNLPAINVGGTEDQVTVYLFAPGIDAKKLDISIQQKCSRSRANVRFLAMRRPPTTGSRKGVQLLNDAEGAGSMLSEGTIYPLLARLERESKLSSRWVLDAEASHPRKYYRLGDWYAPRQGNAPGMDLVSQHHDTDRQVQVRVIFPGAQAVASAFRHGGVARRHTCGVHRWRPPHMRLVQWGQR